MDFDSDYGYDSDEVSNGEPYFALLEEVRRGDLEAIRAALATGACDPNETNEDGYTILHWAVGMTDEEGREETGANKYGKNMVQRRAVVRLLLDQGAKAWAVWQQQRFVTFDCQRPWELTEDNNTKRMVQEACLEQLRHALENGQKLEYGLKESTVCAAAILNRVGVLRMACEHGADVNDDSCDYTPLSAASESGSLKAVKVLVEELSADIDRSIDEYGWTALGVAMINGQELIVEYLIEAGADVFRLTETTIFSCEKDEIVQLVLQAMVHKVASLGPETLNHHSLLRSTFEIFTGLGYIEGLQLLVECGAKFPGNVLQRAVAFGQKDALEYLLAEGALKTHNPHSAKVHAYGIRTCSKEVAQECQNILDQSIEAREEWGRLTSSKQGVRTTF